MLKIAICDDDPQTRRALQEQIGTFAKSVSIDAEFLLFESGSQLVFDYPEGIDLLLLDIQMPGLNGIETAQKIRSVDSPVTIVFLTNYLKYAIDGYKVGAFRYLLKPVQAPQLRQELGAELIRLDRSKRQNLFIRNDDGVFVVPIHEIIFIETSGRSLLLHQNGRIVRCNRTMTEAEEELDSRCFFRCHKSIIINFRHLVEIGKNTAFMENGHELPISKHRRKKMLEAFTSYAGGLL